MNDPQQQEIETLKLKLAMSETKLKFAVNALQQEIETLKLKLAMSEAKLKFAVNALRELEVEDNSVSSMTYAGSCANIITNPIGWVPLVNL